MQTAYALVGARTDQPRGVPQQSSDQALLDRMANGDKLATQALYARHHVRVYRFILRLVGDEALAEDLLSEVFVDVWRHADTFEGNSQVSTWILAIARFKALSALRRRKDYQLDDAVAIAIPDETDDPEVCVQKKDRSAILRSCLGQLSQDHREVIDLVYYHEKSVDEVAQIVGIPANTVKTRMYYARKRMSELLAQAGIDRNYQ
jgi:RNA polymerase sigma-70 factor (ECF subfamily)